MIAFLSILWDCVKCLYGRKPDNQDAPVSCKRDEKEIMAKTSTLRSSLLNARNEKQEQQARQDKEALSPSLQLSDLPTELFKVEILSYLGEAKSFPELLYTVSRFERHCQNETCSFCGQMPVYPYRLVDCSHVACGLCVYTHGVVSCGRAMTGSCGLCGAAIRHRPQRLDCKPWHGRAKWILSVRDFYSRLKCNEERVHRGTAGIFGTNGVPNSLDTFEGIGFIGDFDDKETLDLSNKSKLVLPKHCDAFRVIHCPASCNYSGFPIKRVSRKDLEHRFGRQLLTFIVNLRCDNERDVFILEEEDFGDGDGNYFDQKEHFEVRLVGWDAKSTTEA